MSGNQFHVHGAHDHAVEHEAQHEAGHSAEHHTIGLAQQVAIFTAILSTVGAIISYQGGHTQIEALLYKNESVLKKTEASNQWNYYQSKSTKGNLAELASRLATDPEKAAFYTKEVDRYNQEKKEIQAAAEKLDAQSKAANERSDQAMHPHERLAQSMTLVQIAISLASITVLTRKKWLLVMGGIAAAGGGALWVAALLLH